MRILLTGATGFLGNNLLRLLVEDGHEMVVTVRHSSDRKTLDLLDVEIAETDLGRANEINQAMTGADLVIHAAAMIHIGWRKQKASAVANVQSTRLLAEAARRRGIRMVHVSTVDTLNAGQVDQPVSEKQNDRPKPASAYVTSKRAAEKAFYEQVEQGLDGILVHPGFMVGPWDWKPSSGQMMLALWNNFTPFAPSGGCTVADVRDVACGIIAAYDFGKTGQSYILGGVNMPYLELWKKMSATMGKRGPFFRLPGLVNWAAGRGGDAVATLTGREPVVNSAATQMGALYHYYDSSKAKADLGYEIGSVDTALADAWDWFKKYRYVRS